MRFVQPNTHRIDLKDGPDGEKNWIEIKQDLTAGEAKGLRSAGFRRVSQRKEDQESEIDIDWGAMAFARVVTYLVDWSAAHVAPPAPRRAVSPAAIRALDPEDFDEIDEAIKAYAEAREEEKKSKTKTSGTSSTDSAVSPSPDTAGAGTTT